MRSPVVPVVESPSGPRRPLVVACAALTADLRAVLSGAGVRDAIDVRYLPANLHNTPQLIVGEVRPLVADAVAEGRDVFVAYADCGTGGLLDAMLAEFPQVQRLPGAHCYEFFAGSAAFAALHEQRLGTLYLTDFLAKHFDALLWSGLGLDRAPQLRDVYFANYTTVVLLAQTDDPVVITAAENAAARLGLQFERRYVGRSGLAEPIDAWSSGVMSVSIRGASV